MSSAQTREHNIGVADSAESDTNIRKNTTDDELILALPRSEIQTALDVARDMKWSLRSALWSTQYTASQHIPPDAPHIRLTECQVNMAIELYETTPWGLEHAMDVVLATQVTRSNLSQQNNSSLPEPPPPTCFEPTNELTETQSLPPHPTPQPKSNVHEDETFDPIALTYEANPPSLHTTPEPHFHPEEPEPAIGLTAA
ncbi:hypothetical protein BD410DRAFT_847250, partial [Rickenella mellea]